MNIQYRLYLLLAAVGFAFYMAAAQHHNHWTIPKHEVRAVWLTTLEGLDWPLTKAQSPNTAERQKQELCTMLDRLKAAGINTVLLQTRLRATVIYPSTIEQWDACLTGTYGRAPGYDPLAFAIAECHKRGMEIQAWVVAIPIGKWNSPGCQAIRRLHPGLVRKIGTNGYMDPANPATAKHIAAVCSEITRRYDIDGIHLDYIRYPETWPSPRNANDRAVRQRSITAIVAAVNDSVKRIKSWVKLSCAAIGKHAPLPRRDSKGWDALYKGNQEAQAWLRTGLVDQIYPMIYFSGDDFYPFMADWGESAPYPGAVVAGIAAYRLARGEGDWPLIEVERQMNVARSLGVGVALFRARFLLDDTKGLYGFMKDSFAPTLSLIPQGGQTSSDRPEAPHNLAIKKTQYGQAILRWDTAGQTTFNIYASKSYPVDTADARNLIAVNLKNNSFPLTLAGQQMHFAVTANDRYGRESAAARTGEPAKPKNTIPSNGLIPLPNDVEDTGFILLKDMAGRTVAILPCRNGHAEASRISPGYYAVYTINAKGEIRRIGFRAKMRDGQ